MYASNLRFHLDASNATSYSGSGNNWNDIKNCTLVSLGSEFVSQHNYLKPVRRPIRTVVDVDCELEILLDVGTRRAE